MKLILILVAMSVTCLNATLEEQEEELFDIFETALYGKRHNTSSKCTAKVRECHAVATVLGILAGGLVLINIITVVFFNRHAIRFMCSRWFPALRRGEDEVPVMNVQNHNELFDDDNIQFR